MTGRPRTPTEILALRGAFKRHPERKRQRTGEPVPATPIGPAPAYFDAAQSAAYADLVRQAAAGILCDADGVAVEAAAVLLARMRAHGDAFTAGEFGRLQALLAAFGMSPADRSKVAPRPPPQRGPDPWSEFG
jgi:hypothetical protein